MRRKDCVGEVQIVERTTSIKEVVRSFAENLAFECRVCGLSCLITVKIKQKWLKIMREVV